MTRHTLDHHIEATSGIAGGRPRIAGRRITVQDIAFQHEMIGRSADEIASEFDLTLADVHAALAYYFDHRHEIDDSIGHGLDFVRTLKQTIASKIPGQLNESSG